MNHVFLADQTFSEDDSNSFASMVGVSRQWRDINNTLHMCCSVCLFKITGSYHSSFKILCNFIGLVKHVLILLLLLIRAAQLHFNSGMDACTSKKCSWLPTIAKDVSMLWCIKVNFSVSNRHCFYIQVEPANIRDIQFSDKVPPRTSLKVGPPTDDEMIHFYAALDKS